MSGGSGPALKRQANAAMAAHMKELGIKRESARCPICNGIVSLPKLQNHIETACRGAK